MKSLLKIHPIRILVFLFLVFLSYSLVIVTPHDQNYAFANPVRDQINRSKEEKKKQEEEAKKDDEKRREKEKKERQEKETKERERQKREREEREKKEREDRERDRDRDRRDDRNYYPPPKHVPPGNRDRYYPPISIPRINYYDASLRGWDSYQSSQFEQGERIDLEVSFEVNDYHGYGDVRVSWRVRNHFGFRIYSSQRSYPLRVNRYQHYVIYNAVPTYLLGKSSRFTVEVDLEVGSQKRTRTLWGRLVEPYSENRFEYHYPVYSSLGILDVFVTFNPKYKLKKSVLSRYEPGYFIIRYDYPMVKDKREIIRWRIVSPNRTVFDEGYEWLSRNDNGTIVLNISTDNAPAGKYMYDVYLGEGTDERKMSGAFHVTEERIDNRSVIEDYVPIDIPHEIVPHSNPTELKYDEHFTIRIPESWNGKRNTDGKLPPLTFEPLIGIRGMIRSLSFSDPSMNFDSAIGYFEDMERSVTSIGNTTKKTDLTVGSYPAVVNYYSGQIIVNGTYMTQITENVIIAVLYVFKPESSENILYAVRIVAPNDYVDQVELIMDDIVSGINLH